MNRGPPGRASRRNDPARWLAPPSHRLARRVPFRHALGIALVLGSLAIVLLAGMSLPEVRSSAAHAVSAGATSATGQAGAPNTSSTSPAGFVLPAAANGLSLSIATSPTQICALGADSCPAGVGTSRVTLNALAAGSPVAAWPNVQVAFVIETTAYDGSYWHYFGYPGTDKCADANSRMGLPCEESNGVPFFEDNAGVIASAIQRANPHSSVTFALVDFFGTDCGDWNDCGDSSKYHVDIPTFVPASEFGADVTSTLKDIVFNGGYSGIIGLDDNFLHSPSITALYGAIIGSGLDWSENTHHVIVLVGSTAPRDPAYVENYAVSPFDSCCGGSQADGWTCEPSFSFASGASPNCEGWVKSQDGNPRDSIAALARDSPTCTDSVGKVCTIDIIDYWTTPTDPYSQGWPGGITGGGPGGSIVRQNVNHVLLAGCDLTAATGGSWDGPAWFTCPDGRTGTLEYVPHGSYDRPNTVNPTLMSAMTKISFGPVYQTLIANGTNQSMFNFVPIGSIRVSPNPQWASACSHGNGTFEKTCQVDPTLRDVGGVETYGWNWSTVPDQNAMYVGDSWTVQFNVIAAGPPYATVPVDACVTILCRAAGSGAISGLYTWAYYRPASNTTTVTSSFPLAQVTVELTPPPGGFGAQPPPPPPVPPGIPIIAAPVLPVLSPVGTINSVGVANISLQATAAGFLGAGFTRVGLKNRPIALKMAALNAKSKGGSRFDQASAKDQGPSVGRFE